jgi:DNA primase
VPADVPAALQRLGMTALRSIDRPSGGSEVQARCPMHKARTGSDDRHPSFWVSTASGAFICFSCQYAGPFVQLVADVLGIGRDEALRWIARQGIYRLQPAEDEQPQPAELVTVNEASLALFVPPPPEALAERHLTAQACALYGVLWDPRTSRWIIPIRDPTDGRLLGWQEKNKRFFRNYPDGVKKSGTLFGYHTPHDYFTVLLESPLDAVRLASAGFTGGVASYGAHVSNAQMRLVRHRPGVLILGLDDDTAGRSARDQLYRTWRPRGIRMRFLNYADSTAKDIGDMTSDEEIHHAVTTAYLPFRHRKEPHDHPSAQRSSSARSSTARTVPAKPELVRGRRRDRRHS